jgi:hypothetical protein
MKAYVYLITLTKGNNIENIYGTYTGTKESFEQELLLFNSVSKLLKQGFSLYFSECVLIKPDIAPMNREDT